MNKFKTRVLGDYNCIVFLSNNKLNGWDMYVYVCLRLAGKTIWSNVNSINKIIFAQVVDSKRNKERIL